MVACERIVGYQDQAAYVMAGNRRGHWMRTARREVVCEHAATRRLVVQTGPQTVRTVVVCSDCAADYHRNTRVLVLADDSLDDAPAAPRPLSAYDWNQRMEWPAVQERLAACGYHPGDRVQHALLGVGLVLDVYATRDQVMALVDFGRELRRLSLNYSPMRRLA